MVSEKLLQELTEAWDDYQAALRNLLRLPGGLGNAATLVAVARSSDNAAVSALISDYRRLAKEYREAAGG